MNFLLYMLGVLFVAFGLAYAANRLGVGRTWIIIGVVVIVGLGIMGAVAKTRQKDPPA